MTETYRLALRAYHALGDYLMAAQAEEAQRVTAGVKVEGVWTACPKCRCPRFLGDSCGACADGTEEACQEGAGHAVRATEPPEGTQGSPGPEKGSESRTEVELTNDEFHTWLADVAKANEAGEPHPLFEDYAAPQSALALARLQAKEWARLLARVAEDDR